MSSVTRAWNRLSSLANAAWVARRREQTPGPVTAESTDIEDALAIARLLRADEDVCVGAGVSGGRLLATNARLLYFTADETSASLELPVEEILRIEVEHGEETGTLHVETRAGTRISFTGVVPPSAVDPLRETLGRDARRIGS